MEVDVAVAVRHLQHLQSLRELQRYLMYVAISCYGTPFNFSKCRKIIVGLLLGSHDISVKPIYTL